MPDLQLVVVPAFYLDQATNKITPLDPANALAASDFAPKWAAWRADVKNNYGWEILVSPPAAGTTYTRGFFRTPDDQAAMQEGTTTAAAVDSSAHQAGRAVDVDLQGMANLYPNYDYNLLVQSAKNAGIYDRISSEPWHFDDNPADLYGSTESAIEAVGNLTSQVAALVQQGLASPQAAAVQAYLASLATSPWTIFFFLAVLVAAVLAVDSGSPARETA